MARTLDRAAHAVRRDVFIDAAQRLVHTRGYEQLSIQEVLGEVGASRGAFYHYFDSKEALLEAVVERLVDAAFDAVAPVVDQPGLRAVEKLERLFSDAAAWKSARREIVLRLLQVWFSNENAIVREKVRKLRAGRITPLLAVVIRQGQEEGVFPSGSADELARVLMGLLQGFGDDVAEQFLAHQAGDIQVDEVERTVAAYTQAFERILGLPPASLIIVDRPTLDLWFT